MHRMWKNTQKLTAAMADRHMRQSAYWKAGESVNVLTRRFAFVPPLYRTNGDMPYSGGGV